MNIQSSIKSALLAVVCSPLLFTVVQAEQTDETAIKLLNLQHRWAQVNYQLKDDAQEIAFEDLIKQGEELTKAFPEQAEYWTWYGIIQSSYAGAKGGLGALSLAKDAKESLEKSLVINDKVLQGSAYTSLGTLYHKVPGWPIGFGDDDEAEICLKTALKINPDGIDPNYFYGELLFDDRKYQEAEKFLLKAQAAPDRIERPLADKYRRAEVANLLEKVNKKLKRKNS